MAEVRRDQPNAHALFEQVRSPDTDHRTALAELIRRLAAHLSVERSVVLPTVKRRRLLGPDLSRELKRDHSQMGRLLVRIERRKVDSPDLVDLFFGNIDRFLEIRSRLPDAD